MAYPARKTYRVTIRGPHLRMRPFLQPTEFLVTDSPAIPALPAGVTLREATEQDIAAMMEVVNPAFEEEAFFVNRPRTHPAQLAEHSAADTSCWPTRPRCCWLGLLRVARRARLHRHAGGASRTSALRPGPCHDAGGGGDSARRRMPHRGTFRGRVRTRLPRPTANSDTAKLESWILPRNCGRSSPCRCS